MSRVPPSPPPRPGPSRRAIAVAAGAVVAALVVVGLAAAWLYFFGSPAPEAPTLDDALKVLLPSPSPGS